MDGWTIISSHRDMSMLLNCVFHSSATCVTRLLMNFHAGMEFQPENQKSRKLRISQKSHLHIAVFFILTCFDSVFLKYEQIIYLFLVKTHWKTIFWVK